MPSDPKAPPGDEPRDAADDAAPPSSPTPDEPTAEPSSSSSTTLPYADPTTPSRATPTLLPYATPTRPPRLRTIRQLASFEANLAAAKLEAAGVTCFVIDDNISTAYPLVFASVKLQVPEDEVERAEAVLAEPAADDAGLEDHEHDLETSSVAQGEAESEYVEEAYRCPKCHRKDVELLPLAGFMRNVRFGCFVVLLLPIVAPIAVWLMSSGGSGRPRGGQSPDLFAPELIFAWMVVLGILSFAVLTAKRRKRCRACGHEWQS
jgi:hypothetical protein